MAIWTADRKKLVDQKQLVASALDENMSVRVCLTDESIVDGKVMGETLEGEMASGERVAYRGTLTLYSRQNGFTEIDILDIKSVHAIAYVPN